jgi:type II secretory pathway component PulL
MAKNRPKNKTKGVVFVCQINESSLRVLKCLTKAVNQCEFLELAAQSLLPNLEDKLISEKVKQIFARLKYNNNLVILSLPRAQATCRYLKVPAHSPKEIEKIISFQASKYLPYPLEELLTSYQLVSVDKQGYAHVTFNIVHKRVIERYLSILNAAGIKDVYIAMSSYGLSNLYNSIEEKQTEPVLIVDIDSAYVEFAITLGGRLLFSRSFKFSQKEKLENLLTEETNKTNNTYVKEVGAKAINRLIILGEAKTSREMVNLLSSRLNLAVSAPSYWQNLKCTKNFIEELTQSSGSSASLIGLGLKELPESLNIIPPALKEAYRQKNIRRATLRLFVFIFISILIFSLGLAKTLDNKKRYLGRLKEALAKITPEAKSLEELEKRINALGDYRAQKLSLLDILSQLYQALPKDLSLASFNYEEKGKISLRGQAPQLNSVLSLVSQLEQSPIFNNFNIKVEYATKRKTQNAEMVEFEINCFKE